MKTIKAYELIDHGVTASDYFQGCGVSFTKFDECYTGIGDNALRACEDALEQSYSSGDMWLSDLQDERDAELKTLSDVDDVPEDAEDTYHYFSIRVQYA